MKAKTLFRLAGISLAVGGLLVLPALILHPPSHALQYQGTPQWVVTHALLTGSYVLILVGVFGLYGYLHERLGVTGLIGFTLVTVLCLYSIASFAFDAFTVPAILTTFPGETATDPSGSFNQFPNGLFPLPLSFPIGLVLFGVAIFRSGFGQRWSGIALAASVVLIFAGQVLAFSPLHLDRALSIGHAINSLVFAWIGFGLLRELMVPQVSTAAVVASAMPAPTPTR